MQGLIAVLLLTGLAEVPYPALPMIVFGRAGYVLHARVHGG
ncbi:hypothetical protein AB0L68_10370 [Streptomyces sp. NPDC052164]